MNANYITHVSAKNYRSLFDVSIDLNDTTVLVGKNGSGKSNFVDTLRFVKEALELGLDAAINKRGGIGRIRRWSGRGKPYDVSITIQCQIQDMEQEYTFILGSDKRNEFKVKREFYSSDNSTVFEREKEVWKVTPPVPLPIQERGLSIQLLPMEYQGIYSFLTSMSFYSIFPNTLRNPEIPANPYPLDEYGGNLASVLREFRSSEWYIDLKNSLGNVVPGVIDLQVKRVGSYFVTQLKHEDGSWLDLAQESDGTLRVLGLLSALYQEPPRTLLALEEPELTIHPGALGILCDVIQEASQRSQIIVTTHSPDLIARFNIDELRVVERTNDGTQIGIVDDVQRQVVEEQLFSTSDLLRIEGLRRAIPEA